MNKILCACIFGLQCCLLPMMATAATVRGRVTAEDMPGGVPGVNVVVYRDTLATGLGAATDLNGNFVIPSIPVGTYQIRFDYIGYKSEVRRVRLREDSDLTLLVKLRREAIAGQELEVTASVTRHEMAISNTPVRVEVMVPEEVQDKIAFSNSLDGALRYSGGIVVNTSRSIYEAENIRLRGIDSRYLLLSADQTPVLGYQPEEVGIWTLPLVGIRQIEIAKGDYSALYGFGQAGILNAALRTPFSDSLAFFGLVRSNFEDDRYVGLYAGKRLASWGLSTIFSAENLALPETGDFLRHAILPRLDYRRGGSKFFISGKLLGSRVAGHQTLLDRRGISSGLEFPISEKGRLSLHGQFADQDENYLPDPAMMVAHSCVAFGAVQWTQDFGLLTSIVGMDDYGENWKMPRSNSEMSTEIFRPALFAQEELQIHDRWSVLYGARVFHERLKTAEPPANTESPASTGIKQESSSCWGADQLLALLWKPTYFSNYRLSCSYGMVPPLSHYVLHDPDTTRFFVPSAGLKMERFVSASLDAKWVGRWGGVNWTGGLSVFATVLQNQIGVSDTAAPARLANGEDFVISGAEFFARLDLGEDAAFLLGYTLLVPSHEYEERSSLILPLPRQQGNFELDWEIEGIGVRLELEGKLVSGQKTPDNRFRSSAPPYGVAGATLEYSLGPAKLFSGVENMTDFVQSDAGPLWGPRQGREFYLGLKAQF